MGQVPSRDNDAAHEVQEDVVLYLLRFSNHTNFPAIIMIDDDAATLSLQDKLLCLYKLLNFFAAGCCECDSGIFEQCSVTLPSKPSILKFYRKHGVNTFNELQKNWQVMQKVNAVVCACMNELIDHINKTGKYNFSNAEDMKLQDTLLLMDVFYSIIYQAEPEELCSTLCENKQFSTYCSRMVASYRGLQSESDWHCLL